MNALKDHQIAALVSTLRDIAVEYYGTQQLRERIAEAVHVAVVQSNAHPDDAAVDQFAVALKEKLADARAKGRNGWKQCDPAELSIMLREHVEKCDPRDVANFCLFLWYLGKSIAPAARGTSAQIQMERKLTCEMIDGAMAFGYQNTNPPPSDDHWLAPFWKIGRQQAELEARITASHDADHERRGWKLVPIEPTVEMLTFVYDPGASTTPSERYAALLAAAPVAPAAVAPNEDAYVAQRMTEVLAEVYTTIIGDDARPEDDSLNAIERVKKAAQVLRLEVDLYRSQRDEVAAQLDERATCMCSGLGPCERPGDASCRISRAASQQATMGDEWAAFKWPPLPAFPESFAPVAGQPYFTEHQMQGYANAYGELVRRAAVAQAGASEPDQFDVATAKLTPEQQHQINEALDRADAARASAGDVAWTAWKESKFEGWYADWAATKPVHQTLKQTAREAYAAGMVDTTPQTSGEMRDVERLDWLMHNLGGYALHAIGVIASGNCDRAAIDAAMGSAAPVAQAGASESDLERVNAALNRCQPEIRRVPFDLLTEFARNLLADVKPGASEPSAYNPPEAAVRQACDLLDKIKGAYRHWGGWSGTPGACDEAINLLRYAGTNAAPVAQQAGAALTDWKGRCEAIVDMYDDARNNAPEDRSYVDGAFSTEIAELRALLAAQQPKRNADLPDSEGGEA